MSIKSYIPVAYVFARELYVFLLKEIDTFWVVFRRLYAIKAYKSVRLRTPGFNTKSTKINLFSRIRYIVLYGKLEYSNL